jgi:hypothetical protein
MEKLTIGWHRRRNGVAWWIGKIGAAVESTSLQADA